MTRPGYRMTEIGEIPKNWNVKSLDNMIEILDLKRVPLSETERANKKGTIPYCGANGIIDYIDDYIFDEEAVLIAEDGGNYGKFQNKAYIMTGKYWVNNHAHIFRGRSELLENKFIMQWLNFSDISPYVSGSTRTKLNQEMLKRILVPTPSLQEQKKITEILSTADETIQKVNEEIILTKKLKKGLMQTLLTKGIGHTKFKMTEIGEIPVEWNLTYISSLVSDLIGGGTPSTTNSIFWNGDIPWTRGASLNNHYLERGELFITKEGLIHSSTNLIGAGNILLATRVSVGNVSINKIEVAISQDVTALILKKDLIFTEYLYWYLKRLTIQIQQKSQGSIIKGILKSDLSKILIPLPSLLEQQKIAEILSTVDHKLELLRNKKTHLEELKKSMMEDLLTGRVRVKIETSKGEN